MNVRVFKVQEEEEYMKLSDLMINPYMWLFLSVCTIGGFGYAIYSRLADKRKKEFSYVKKSYKIIEEGKSCIKELKVSYGSRNIENLSITKYAIWNSGNEVINCIDIVKDRPLEIQSSNKNSTVILDARIIMKSDESNKFEITNVKDDSVTIKLDYVDPKEGIVVQIVHTGISENIELKGKIKGGKKLKNISEKRLGKTVNRKKRNKFLIFCMAIYIFLLLIIWGVSFGCAWGIFPADIFQNDNLNNMAISRFYIICTGVLLLWVIHMLWHRIKYLYNINIPSKLRDSLEDDELEN